MADTDRNRATPWQKHGNTERRVRWTPGYDCRVKCEHDVKGDHGQHGDELRLDVRLPDAASTLLLFTFARDGQITYRYQDGSMVMTAGVSYHFAFRSTRSDDGEMVSCDVLTTGRCYPWCGRMLTSVAEKDDHWNHGGWVWSNADQAALNDGKLLVHPEIEHIVLAMPSGVWGRLEADLAEWRTDALGMKADG